jgi:peptide/nickel transport system substrate-binding protein
MEGITGARVQAAAEDRLGLRSRRQMLRSFAVVGGSAAVGALLAACGGGTAATPTAGTSGTATAAVGSASAPTAAPAVSGGATTGASTTAAGSVVAGNATVPAGKVGGEITMAQSSDATSLDPAKSTATVDSNIYLAIFNRLAELDEKGTLVPSLAESWEEAPDHLTWTLHLRKGVKFHDGTDFNADAVKTNLERYIDPKLNSPRAGEIPYVTGVTVVDPYTAKVNLSQPFVIFMYSMTGVTGTMISPAAIQKYGDDLARNPVGTGPFVFKEWIKGDHVAVTRNPSFWRSGLPYLNTVNYKGIADTTVILNGMKSGAIQTTYGVPAKEVPALKTDPNFQLIIKPSTSISALRFNLAAPPFDKKEIRQALAWTVDRAAIEKAIYFDTGVPANTFLGPQNLGFNDQITLYKSVDTAKAKQLLAAGGQPNGFKFTAQITNTPEGLQLAQAIKSQLEAINVTMDLQLVDGVTALNNLTAKQFTATFTTFNGGVEPFQGLNRFFFSKSPLDVYGYVNPQYDDLLTKAAATGDDAARAKIYQQMTAILSEDCPWVFLRYPAQTELFRKELKGYIYNPDGGLRLDTVSMAS